MKRILIFCVFVVMCTMASAWHLNASALGLGDTIEGTGNEMAQLYVASIGDK
ncbi:MAG: hypothetical protein KDC66_02195 [Phaeodactylibacter sp.]|nr:hypothetical protein [Phaeodactylibacter sp.]MCB9272664.1 hypothetical protein [Lewinellaceae bacterium]